MLMKTKANNLLLATPGFTLRAILSRWSGAPEQNRSLWFNS